MQSAHAIRCHKIFAFVVIYGLCSELLKSDIQCIPHLTFLSGRWVKWKAFRAMRNTEKILFANFIIVVVICGVFSESANTWKEYFYFSHWWLKIQIQINAWVTVFCFPSTNYQWGSSQLNFFFFAPAHWGMRPCPRSHKEYYWDTLRLFRVDSKMAARGRKQKAITLTPPHLQPVQRISTSH
jgi:hypothetical protein